MDEYPCYSCGAPIVTCELCKACAEAQRPVDLEAAGGWMVQESGGDRLALSWGRGFSLFNAGARAPWWRQSPCLLPDLSPALARRTNSWMSAGKHDASTIARATHPARPTP